MPSLNIVCLPMEFCQRINNLVLDTAQDYSIAEIGHL